MLKQPVIVLAPGADENGLAVMLSDLVRQNLDAKPHKLRDFRAISGRVAIVAEDAGVALTLHFQRDTLTIHSGIEGIPDVTVRADADSILAMSNVPLTRRLGLPIAMPKDAEGRRYLASLVEASRSGRMQVFGMLANIPMLLRLTRVMSVNG